MMKHFAELITLTPVTENGVVAVLIDNGAKGPIPTGYDYVTLHSTGTFVATLTWEISNDGVNWVTSPTLVNQATPSTLASTITATGLVMIAPLATRYARLRCTSYTSGTAKIFAVGGLGDAVVMNQPSGSQTVAGTVVSSFTPVAATGGFTTHRHIVSAASTNSNLIKSTTGMVGSVDAVNTTASNKYLKLYNKATAPTVGTDTPFKTYLIPPNSTLAINYQNGIRFSLGLGIGITGGATVEDTTAVAVTDVIANITYI